MSRNIIVTGAAGGLGRAVIEKFKREGYHLIALLRPGHEDAIEDADNYEVDVTSEEAVAEFVKEYQIQYGELDAIVMLVGGFASGNLETTTQAELTKMFQLNFFSAFQMVQGFLPLVKK